MDVLGVGNLLFQGGFWIGQDALEADLDFEGICGGEGKGGEEVDLGGGLGEEGQSKAGFPLGVGE